MAFKVPEQYRNYEHEVQLTGASMRGDETHGCFGINSKAARRLTIIASGSLGWEHVSVTCRQGKKQRTPTWEEMCFVKAQFWGPEDCVIQFHPPESEYVNHTEALHLWRQVGVDIERPPMEFV